MKTFRDRLLTVTAGLLLALSTAGAGPPGFNIQGRLTDANGVNREGSYSIKFNLYDTVTGGTALWTRTYPALTVRNGNFQTVLGDVTGQPMLSDVFAAGDSRFLEIQVLSGPGVTSPEAPLVPRQQLVSVPYTLKAAVADSVNGVDVQGPIISGRASASMGGLKLYNAATPNATVIQAGNATSAVTYKLPPADGVAGQVLSTDGNGNLSWSAGAPANGPALSSVNPVNGPASGGTPITLTGTGFKSGASVTLGGSPAGGVIVINSMQISAVTPPGTLGSVNIVVQNPDNFITTLVTGFSYVLQSGCANGITGEVYSDAVHGCNGLVTYSDRASLCAPGWRVYDILLDPPTHIQQQTPTPPSANWGYRWVDLNGDPGTLRGYEPLEAWGQQMSTCWGTVAPCVNSSDYEHSFRPVIGSVYAQDRFIAYNGNKIVHHWGGAMGMGTLAGTICIRQ